MSTRLRLLLIEDSEDDAALVVGELTRGGYDVVVGCVETAAALTGALARQRWDLAIADFTMPRFSGTEALAVVRQHDAELPFIFVSGTAGEEAAVAAMKIGADDYLMKSHLQRLVPSVERELREATVRRERKRADERLAHLAYHDPLTDLPNRMLLHDRLRQAALTAQRDRKPLALLVMDLDRFKEVNDTWGHPAGDSVLQQTAARLRSLLRESDTVARLGGDEFALVLPFTEVDGARQTARKVLQAFERPFVVNNRPLTVRVSVGIAQFPDHGANAEALLQKADIAMYLAKADRSGCAVYDPDRDRHAHRQLELTTEIRQGIEGGAFVLEYQPILQLRTGRVTGVESLLRWDHPAQGRLAPIDFIDLAEQTGLISTLTMFVLEKSVREWTDADGLAPFSVGVNLSARNLHDPRLPDRVRDILQERGATPSILTLEITENVLMSDPNRSMACLTRLRDLGVRLAIDDFGTGYSSLSYLRRLPVHEVKVDQSFVAGLARGEDEVIIRSTIDLAHNLGLSVVAEGVENEAVRDRLTALGCDHAQGLLISQPRSAAALRMWLAESPLAR